MVSLKECQRSILLTSFYWQRIIIVKSSFPVPCSHVFTFSLLSLWEPASFRQKGKGEKFYDVYWHSIALMIRFILKSYVMEFHGKCYLEHEKPFTLFFTMAEFNLTDILLFFFDCKIILTILSLSGLEDGEEILRHLHTQQQRRQQRRRQYRGWQFLLRLEHR